ncbi:MAG: class I SAM-dependent methyltransferase [Pseudomonadota bacterium]
MKNTEKLCLSQWRTELLGNVRGDILEIGSGTGVNLKYYPYTINQLVLSEPNINMRHYLNKRIEDAGRDNISMAHNNAESIDFPDESFDYIVSTLVLCSVTDQLNCLTELKRLLRPNGKLLFIEHVAAEDNPRLFKWQKRIEPFWKIIGGNCHLTRNTESVIKQAGFNSIQLEKTSFLGAPSIVGPIIKGIAHK